MPPGRTGIVTATLIFAIIWIIFVAVIVWLGWTERDGMNNNNNNK